MDGVQNEYCHSLQMRFRIILSLVNIHLQAVPDEVGRLPDCMSTDIGQ